MTQKGEREALFLTRARQGFRIVHRMGVATRALHVDSLRIARGSRDDENGVILQWPTRHMGVNSLLWTCQLKRELSPFSLRAIKYMVHPRSANDATLSSLSTIASSPCIGRGCVHGTTSVFGWLGFEVRTCISKFTPFFIWLMQCLFCLIWLVT